MSWILFLIVLTHDGPMYEMVDTFDTMDKCFTQRQLLVKEWGRPLVNYQAICVARDFN